MRNRRQYMGYVFALLLALAGVNDVFGSSGTILTLNSTRYCAGDPWNLKVTTYALPNTEISLIGTSNDTTWEIPHWATTDANGDFSTAGVFATETAGKHTLHVVTTNGSNSDFLSF